MCVYQVEGVQVVLQNEALHGTLQVCEDPQSLGGREGGGERGCSQQGGGKPLLWEPGEHMLVMWTEQPYAQ